MPMAAGLLGDADDDARALRVRRRDHGDELYCIYVSPSAELIREHARLGAFPASRVAQVRRMVDPRTAA
jgi:hypothetical protein